MYQTKRMAGYLFAFLAVIQLAAFFLYSQITANVESKWLIYLVYWIRNTAEATVPILTATAAFLLFSAGHKKVLLFPILPVLSRVLYFLPDFYLYYIADDLNTAEALAMAAIVTVIECAIIYGFVLLLYLLAKHIYTKSEKEKGEDGFFSLENPFTKSVFFICFAYFCLQMVIEIINTVSYLITNAGTYTLEEILTILLSFILHLAMLLLMQIIAVAYTRYAKAHYMEAAEEPGATEPHDISEE